MAVTIKIRENDKEKLDQLRAKLLIKGVKLNQEELLSRLVELGENFFVELDTLPMKKLSNNEINEIMKNTYDLGYSSEETVDRDIYGE